MSDRGLLPAPAEHESAHETAEQYRIALENTPIIFARVDAELRYEWIYNPRADFDPAAVVGKRDDELDSGPGIEALIDLKQRVLTEGVQARQEITFDRSDGPRTYEITATPVHNEVGEITHLVTSALDITGRKIAEDALRKSEHQQRQLAKSLEAERDRLAAVLENLPIGVWLAARDGRLISKNKQSDRIWVGDAPLSNSVDEYTQYDASYPHNGQRLLPEEYPVARALRTGESIEPVELRIRRFDGTEGTVLVSAAPIKDRQGRLTGVVGINMDITDRKQAEEALQQMNELLEERVEERSREVRSLVTQLTMSEQAERRRISHILHDDLQQHIYSLIFQLAVLRSSVEAQAQDDALAMIDEIEQALKLSVEITRSLSVDFSPPVLHNEGLVEAVHWLVTQMGRKHKLAVDVQVEDELPLMSADLRVLLFQIIRELLFNVIKHAGVLQAVVSLTRIDGLLCIQVKDRGRGFDVSSLKENSIHSNGMLQIGRRLALVGGRLEIESYPAQGTSITVYCPLDNGADSRAQ